MTSIKRGAVLAALREKAPRALHLAELCTRLQISKSRMDEVAAVLDQLVGTSDVTEMPGRRYRIKPAKIRQAVRSSRKERPSRDPRRDEPIMYAATTVERGHLQRNPRGFGFVSPESRTEDIFIPPDSMGAAMHGDRVEVLARPSKKGREGRVVAVLERGSKRFSATLRREGDAVWLEPDDVRLPSEVEVSGDVSEKSDLAVVAEFVRFPQSDTDIASAKVVDVLGVQGMTAVEVAKIKIREGVVEEFGVAAMAEAELLPDVIPESDFEGRVDLRDVDLTTIDPSDARDHDDALWCEETDSGFRLYVAIADVSHYVREGTAIDQEAIARMTSIYLPDRAIPMLPEKISSGLASLVPDEDRLCMAVEIELGPNGAVRRYRLMEGVMRSRARLTYEGVAQALGLTKDGPVEPEADKRVDGLTALYELSRVLRRRRLRRGALDFDLPEPRIVLDAHNVEPIDVRRSRKDPGVREAYRIVEEMMLLANETVAADVKSKEVPCIHRIHGSPDDKKIEKFAKLAQALGYDINAEDARDPKKLSKFLGTIDGTEQAPVLRYLLLRSMQQASYDIDEITGHFGLAAKDYLHFTSPIRRYPDLSVHRIVKSILRNEHVDAATLVPRLTRFSADASRLERRAITVERHVIDLYRAILMRDRMGEEFDAAVSSVDPGGIYVRFDEPFVEAFIPIERLDDDYYELGDLGIRLIGTRTGTTFALGDKIRVRLEDINISRRQLLAVPTTFGPPRQRPVGRTGQRTSERPKRDNKRGGKRDEKRGGKRDDKRDDKRGGKRDDKRGKKKDKERDSKRTRSGNTSHAAPRSKDEKPKRTRKPKKDGESKKKKH